MKLFRLINARNRAYFIVAESQLEVVCIAKDNRLIIRAESANVECLGEPGSHIPMGKKGIVEWDIDRIYRRPRYHVSMKRVAHRHAAVNHFR